MYRKLIFMFIVLVSLPQGCTTTSCPDCFVNVPANDSTDPNLASMIVSDQGTFTFNQSSQATTIIAISDVVSVLASARDDDGGLKAVRIWSTTTYFSTGQVAGPGLPGVPTAESVSNATVGDTASKNRLVGYDFDLGAALGSWSRIEVDIWIEGENFHGGKKVTPPITLSYPTRQANDTNYMVACRKRSVPIPPDWIGPATTAWTLQGNLSTNLLIPGGDAFVWTYSDPVRRGACIALPRGSGGQRGGLAGIICQSATTGWACFWDSRRRNDSAPMTQVPALNWSTEPLIISELKDATNLTEPESGRCPDCHRGNNVFLISPDDPTWEKVLRGSLVTDAGSTFTTAVESSDDTSAGHPRYIPSTFPANRPDWVNTFQPGGCAAACHENPPLGTFDDPVMPPACAANNADDCYQ